MTCDCPETCQSYSFETTISSLKWPNNDGKALTGLCSHLLSILTKRINESDDTCTSTSYLAKQVADGTPYDVLNDLNGCTSGQYRLPIMSSEEMGNLIIGKQYAEVYIYYRDFNYQTIIQYESIDIAGIFANVGGIVGLFFGFSFLTCFEYVQLGFDLIGIAIVKIMESGKTGKNTIPDDKEKGEINSIRNHNLYTGKKRSAILPYPVPPS